MIVCEQRLLDTRSDCADLTSLTGAFGVFFCAHLGSVAQLKQIVEMM
jgi:hypothetical protein